ncbi:hypothetical protein OIO90_001413 [Microbotryomycetes sp. JL221]|nr:hypothetical protein OIO90_001413 [Microbotryomycetes sp. JL221]
MSLLLLSTVVTSSLAHRPPTLKRQGNDGVRTWQQQAAIQDPIEECTPYDYPPVSNIIHTYPPVWDIADLSNPNIDPEVIALFNKINASIPNIPIKGSPDGQWFGGYDGVADPDCWWTYTGCTTPKIKSLPTDVTQCNEPKSWGLTLDDGPNCTHNAFYDFLQQNNQTASLFYIGSNVLDWPLEAQRGFAMSNTLNAHTYSHHYMTGLTNEQAFAELYFSKKAIKDVVNVTVRAWRPPFGDVDDRIRFIAQALDMKTIVWSEDTDDWNWVNLGVPKIESNYKSIIGQVDTKYTQSGAIVLTHELNNETMSLVEEFYPQIKTSWTGGVMPYEVCMNITTPYLETEGYVYPNYEQYMSGTRTIQLSAPTALGTGQILQFASISTNQTSSRSNSAVMTSITSSTMIPTSSMTSSNGDTTSKSKSGSMTASAANQSKTPITSSNTKDHNGSQSQTATFGTMFAILFSIILACTL